MRCRFSILYSSAFGERVFLSGSIPELRDSNKDQFYPMIWCGDRWEFEIEIPVPSHFHYSYFVKNDDNIRGEAGGLRELTFSDDRDYFILDEWCEAGDDSPLYSSAFRNVLFTSSQIAQNRQGDCTIRIAASPARSDVSIIICGSTEQLGKWDPAKGIILYNTSEGYWQTVLSYNDLHPKTEYKFLLCKTSKDSNNEYIWEEGKNRVMNIPGVTDNTRFIITHSKIRLPGPEIRLAGTAIPLFSLKTAKSSGIGDFGDLREMVDFMAESGQKILQLLPLNDTTKSHNWRDSYPYSPVSVFALHPLYINLEKAGIITDEDFMEQFSHECRKLNALPYVDYPNVDLLKWSYLKKLFLQDGEICIKSDSFKSFYSENKDWLKPYSIFSALRERYKTSDFNKWPSYSTYDSSQFAEQDCESSKLLREADLYLFVQYHLHRQLEEAHQYAVSKKIVLKGDLPVGVDRESSDVWAYPSLFITGSHAGAPPDSFAAKGQNWKFPLYNWEEMEKDHYSWWKRRIQKLSEYFDAYRIDHILGFFRIWDIPADSSEALKGCFNPSLPFTSEEIRSNGYPFDLTRDTLPCIDELLLEESFGEDKKLIVDKYLNKIESGYYTLKSEYDSEMKIRESFTSGETVPQTKLIDNLISLTDEVLFLSHKNNPEAFSPRIAAQFTASYRVLPKELKENFNRLYDNYFYLRNNSLWSNTGRKRLTNLISFSSMLVCGEDLGMVPQCVPDVMKKLGILSLKVQRIASGNRILSGSPDNYPYLSVCTTGTHDMSTLRGWCRENNNLPDECHDRLYRKILTLNLESGSMLAIFPLQDWLSLFKDLQVSDPGDERINIPSDSNNKWCYRMPSGVDELRANKKVSSTINEMIMQSGRTVFD